MVNAPNGDVNEATVFDYYQEDDLVWASYSGGSVRFGTLVAKVDSEGQLDMRYNHVSETGDLKTGMCVSVPEVLPDGRIRLHETWQWTCEDFSSGTSIVEEIPQPQCP